MRHSVSGESTVVAGSSRGRSASDVSFISPASKALLQRTTPTKTTPQPQAAYEDDQGAGAGVSGAATPEDVKITEGSPEDEMGGGGRGSAGMARRKPAVLAPPMEEEAEQTRLGKATSKWERETENMQNGWFIAYKTPTNQNE